MNVHEVIAAWKEAQDYEGRGKEWPDFHERFFQLTGLTREEVEHSFKQFNLTRHDRVNAIAAKHGVELREGGFQAFLVERFWPEDPGLKAILAVARYLRHRDPEEEEDLSAPDLVDRILDCQVRLGRPPLEFVLFEGPLYGTGDPREGKDWPPEEDCPGCPGRAGVDGPHKMSCSSEWGSKANGRMTVPGSYLPLLSEDPS